MQREGFMGSGFIPRNKLLAGLSVSLLCVLFVFATACGSSKSNSGGSLIGGGSPGGGSPGGGSPGGTAAPELLYALNVAIGSPNAAISGFTSNSSGQLTPIGQPTNLTTDPNSGPSMVPHPSGKFLFVTSGLTIATYTVAPNGTLTSASSVPAPEIAYWMSVDPTGHFLYINQSAGNAGSIITYSIDQNTGALTQVGQPQPMPLGALVMDPKGRFLYVVNIGTVQAFSINTTTGALTPAAATSGLNDDVIYVTPDGRFMYIGPQFPRGTGEAITPYSINPASGALTQTGTETILNSGGPVFDPSSRFAFANDPAGIRAFTIDTSTGNLIEISGSPFSRGAVAAMSTNGIDALTVDRSGRFLFVSDGKQVGSFAIGSDGSLSVVGSPAPLTGASTTAIELVSMQAP